MASSNSRHAPSLDAPFRGKKCAFCALANTVSFLCDSDVCCFPAEHVRVREAAAAGGAGAAPLPALRPGAEPRARAASPPDLEALLTGRQRAHRQTQQSADLQQKCRPRMFCFRYFRKSRVAHSPTRICVCVCVCVCAAHLCVYVCVHSDFVCGECVCACVCVCVHRLQLKSPVIANFETCTAACLH